MLVIKRLVPRATAIMVAGTLLMANQAAAQLPTASPSSDSAFFAGQWARALPGYLALARTDTTTAVLWFRLGVSHHGLGHYADAIAALERVHRIGGFQPLAVRLRLARAYARNGDRDKALAFVDSVGQLAANGVQPAQLSAEADFADIRDDARYKTAMARIEAVRYPCRSSAQEQQFNFWIGQWDVNPWALPSAPAGAAGFNDVHPILEHCVIYENWKGAGGGEGKSFNYYDRNLDKWRQIWMADGGGALDYTGEYRDGAMRFTAWTLDAAGKRVEQKLTFTPFGRDTVRQTFEVSIDGGKTWTVTFDGRYVRQKAKPGS